MSLSGLRRLTALEERWLAWSGGEYPDDSPGDVIHADYDGTIVLDDGITTWNPLRALAWFKQRDERNSLPALLACVEAAQDAFVRLDACPACKEDTAARVSGHFCDLRAALAALDGEQT